MSARKQKVRIDKIVVHWEYDPTAYSTSTLGVYAVAHVSYQMLGSNDRRLETLQSGGLWGIEVLHLAPRHRTELTEEQLDELRSHLTMFGIRPSAAEWAELRRAAIDPAFAHGRAFAKAVGHE